MKVTRKTYYAVNFILFFIALILSFAVTTIMLYRRQDDSAKEKTQLLTAQVGGDLGDTLARIDQTSKALFLNTDFQDLTGKIYTGEEYLETMYGHFDLIIMLDQYLFKNVIYLPRSPEGELDKENTVSYGLGYEYIQYNIDEIIELAELDENANGKAFFKRVYYADGGNSPFYAVARNINDMRNTSYFEKMGIGMLFINANQLGDALDYSKALDGLKFCILDGDEVIISSAGFDKSSLSGGRYFTTSYELGKFGWRVVGVYDTGYVWRAIESNFVFLLLITVVAGVGFVTLSSLVYRKSTESLEYLFKALSDYNGSGEHVAHGGDPDVNKVIDSFNGVIDSVVSLNSEVLEQKNRFLTLELENTEYMLGSLYSQINKHFLINVLSLMRSLENLGESEKVKSCIENLSDFLRYSLTINDKTTVGQEFSMISSYLKIQAMRYPNVECETEFDPKLSDTTVPKMILQPIIENAFVHGLQHKKGKIRVICRGKNGYIYFFVIDDGQGMDGDKVKEINTCLKNNEKINSLTGSGVALSNVRQRLRLISGEKSFIRLYSRKGKGTIVMVKIYGGNDNVESLSR